MTIDPIVSTHYRPAIGPIFDCHLHIYNSAFPYVPEAALRPAPALVADYLSTHQSLGVQRVVVVQPTSYGYDNRCTLDAVARFGLDSAKAVVVVPPEVSDDALRELAAAGACGVRVNAMRGAPLDTEAISSLATKIATVGWHLQLHVDGAQLPFLSAWINTLPVPVVLDHMGRLDVAQREQSADWCALQDLLKGPNCSVKLSAPYLLQPTGGSEYAALSPLVDMLLSTAPHRVLWGSDWPHPGWYAQGNPQLDDVALTHWAWRHLERHGAAHTVLVENPARMYEF